MIEVVKTILLVSVGAFCGHCVAKKDYATLLLGAIALLTGASIALCIG